MACSPDSSRLCAVQVALTVFYHTDAANFTSTFFNRTIDITEVPALIDVQGLFLLAALAGLLGALGAPPLPSLLRGCKPVAGTQDAAGCVTPVNMHLLPSATM